MSEPSPSAQAPGDREPLVWCASYGSNLYADSMASYLRGGTVPGRLRRRPGARCPRLARDVRWYPLPGSVYFAKKATTWEGGGGVAFYDPERAGPAAARAYLMARDQFDDVLAQENNRTPGAQPGVDFAQLLGNGSVLWGTGWYALVLHVGDIDGRPVLTFTTSESRAGMPINRPERAYLKIVARGLAEARGCAPEGILSYLLGLEGIAGRWDPAKLTEVITVS